MDAFAVAICIGLAFTTVNAKKVLTVGLYFGVFQAIMPFIGYMAAIQFARYISAYDHWFVFALLAFLGGKMISGSIKEQRCQDRECLDLPCNDRKCPIGRQEISLKPVYMLPLALATSIDAMAAGISMAFLQINIFNAIILIGAITFVMSVIGVKIGSVFGAKFKSKATIAGGIILILIGLKVLLESTIFAN